ncbi:hypothetical protein ACQKG5_25430, partial [Serratia bockelmannii]|uniref:hypothetical protein n=1 Tax=Serratia bockelmannii TaxID=2703793 RepID=UPI003D04FD8F
AVGLIVRYMPGHAGPDPATESLIGMPLPLSAPEHDHRELAETHSREADERRVEGPRFVATYRIGVEPDPGPVEPDDEAS